MSGGGKKPIGSFYVQLGLNTKSFQKNLLFAQRSLRAAFGTAALHASEVLAASIAGIGAALAALGTKAVQMASSLERQRLALERMLGSAEAAVSKIKELQEFSSKTGLGFDSLVDYQKRLMAVGFSAEETRFMLYQIADATVMVGREADNVDRLIKAFGDVKAKGTLQTQEIRQFAELGIPVWDMLAKSIGKTREELVKLVEGRRISAGTALYAITEEMRKRWGGAAEGMVKTTDGAFNRLKTAIQIHMTELGEWLKKELPITETFNTLADTVNNVAAAIRDRGLSGALDDFASKFPAITYAVKQLAEMIAVALLPGLAATALFAAMAIVPLLGFVVNIKLAIRAMKSLFIASDFLMETLKQSFLALGEWIASTFRDIQDGLMNMVFVGLRTLFYDIKSWLAVSLDKLVDSLVKRALEFGNVIKSVLKDTIGTAVFTFLDEIKDLLGSLQFRFLPDSHIQRLKEAEQLVGRVKDSMEKAFAPHKTTLEGNTNAFKQLAGVKGSKEEREADRDREIEGYKSEAPAFSMLTDLAGWFKKMRLSGKKGASEALQMLVDDYNSYFEGILQGLPSFLPDLKKEALKLFESVTKPSSQKDSGRPKSPYAPDGAGSGNGPESTVGEGRKIKERHGLQAVYSGWAVPEMSPFRFDIAKRLTEAFTAAEKVNSELNRLRKQAFDLKVELGRGIADAFTSAMNASGNFFKNLGEGFRNLGRQILAQAANMLMLGSLFRAFGISYSVSGLSLNPIFKRTETPASINDGVVQKGKVISTHPDDYIFAVKDPSSLGGKADVVVNVNNNSTSEVTASSCFDGAKTVVDIVIDGLRRNVHGLSDIVRAI